MASGQPQHVVRCAACGRTLVWSPGEVFDYLRDGWPDCCGETVRPCAEPPRPDDPAP